MSLLTYHPEMNEAKPDAKIEASLGHYGKHYYIKSAVELKGRGITFRGRIAADQLTPQAQHKAGWFEYVVTLKAFEKICKDHDVGYEMLLD